MKKIFHFDCEVSTALATSVTDFISHLEQDDELVIMMNSNGGSVVAGLAIYDLINALPNYTECNIIGMCASAATYAAMACDHVVMQPSASYMIHECSGYIGGTPREMARDLAYVEDLQERVIAMYGAKAVDLTPAEIREMMENVTYMTAQEALDYGFVDAVPGLTRQPVNKTEDEEPVEDEKKDEGIVNRILSIFNRPKEDDIIKAPTEAEVAKDEEVMRLSNVVKEKDMELENLHKSLAVKEEELQNKIDDFAAREVAFADEMQAKEQDYQNKVAQMENAVKTEIANRLAALGYDEAELPKPKSPANNADMSVYDKILSEMSGRN